LADVHFFRARVGLSAVCVGSGDCASVCYSHSVQFDLALFQAKDLYPMTEQLPIMYGIWLRGRGWLRGGENRALMFTEKQIAQETARRIGGGKVYFIDQSLVDIEQELLKAEMVKISLFRRIHQVLRVR
jgi:hypothetical protein